VLYYSALVNLICDLIFWKTLHVCTSLDFEKYRFKIFKVYNYYSFLSWPTYVCMCPAGQTNGHSSPWPYHKLSRCMVKLHWTQTTLLMLLSSPTGLFQSFATWQGWQKGHLKQTCLSITVFTVFGQCLSVAIIIITNKNRFQFLCIHGGFSHK